MFDPARLAQLASSGTAAAVCTVVATRGSTPRKAGATMVVIADGSDAGRIEGTVGGGAIEHLVRKAALEVIATLAPRTLEVPLTTTLGMCCGGTMTVFIEALRLRPPCILFGAGHVAEALCAIAARSGFDVTVVDPRDELRTPERFPAAAALVDDYDHDDSLRALPWAPDAFVVVATHDHGADQRLAEAVLRRHAEQPLRYVAVVGSARKAALTRERCRHKGLAEDVVAFLRCPAGVALGAETPDEIALSIVAEMVQVRRGVDAGARSL
ncbi:MAG: XdhC family protein, partial [Deltaproteobacteria bacterium]|nr:XdhC family protein [Deltaproteobacteria bacterium]